MLIRTGEEEIRGEESEVGADSDRRRGNQRGRVRSWCWFGQEKRKSEGESPKLVHTRTREGENREEESEAGAHSDRRRGNQRERVRSWRTFGQEKKKSEGESPKPVHIWAGKEEIREFESEAEVKHTIKCKFI
ncbi:hypothetical protein QUF73_17880 [Cytobacillus sp. NJ13]|nr:hypothetical protein [Cytobacillus sp. NJ13]